jgi:hypothetical protein
MSTDILAGDVRVHYLGEARQKRLEWIGSATGTRTVNELYSALEDLMDEPNQSDDGSAMSAETPVEYTIGIIDAGDLDPWYMSYNLSEHLTGGAIRTASWARAVGTNTGIVVVAVTSATIVAADEGIAITHADGDSGVLLEVIEAGATDYLIIRPDDSAAGNSFDSSAGVLTCNSNTATQAGASLTGEQIWANLYNVTPIEADTHVYMYQGTVADDARARIQRIDNAGGDWWDEGAFDRLIYIRDFKAAAAPVIDGGYVTVFARKANTLYASFEVGVSTVSGGRNPIPLSAAADGNHTTGWKSITTTAVGTDDFAVGDEIQDSVSGARGILTLIAGSSPTYTFHYYLIGDPQVVFDSTASTITNNDATGSATKDANPPANQGPALASWFTSGVAPTATHGATTVDIDDNGTAEGWGVTIDCNQSPLTEVYEWMQYVAQNGQTATTFTDGIEGEQYVGATVYLEYSGTVTLGTIGEGDDVIQTTSGATGIVISHDVTLKQILLRDTRGSFDTTNAVVSQDNAGSLVPNTTATTFAANTQSPFGSLAGGRFFGARGVVLTDYLATDENSFQLIDSQGNERTRPIAIVLEVTNLDGGAETVGTNDLVSLLRLTGSGGVVDKLEFSATGGEVQGATTLVVDTAIGADVPGKSAGGVLTLRDKTDEQEYRLRFTSWATSTFTLASVVIAAADAATTTTITEAGAFTNTKRGDLVYNVTRSLWAYVLTVTDANNIVLSGSIAGQTTGDNIELNTIPIALVDTADDVFVHLMNRYATAATEQVSIVYVSPIFYRAKVTNKRAAIKIKPFVTADSTSGTDRSIAVIRNADTIAA